VAQQRLQQQPLGDETVARWQGRRGECPGGHQGGGGGHPAGQAAQLVKVAGPGRGEYRAGAEEQHSLESGVVDAVEQGGGQGEGGERGLAGCGVHAGEADAEQDQADVLAGGECQQTFEVGGDGGLHDAVQRGRGSQQCNGQPPPAGSTAE
jgi:hypothetical protein